MASPEETRKVKEDVINLLKKEIKEHGYANATYFVPDHVDDDHKNPGVTESIAHLMDNVDYVMSKTERNEIILTPRRKDKEPHWLIKELTG